MSEVALDKIPAAEPKPIVSKDLLQFVEKNATIANLAQSAFRAFVKVCLFC